ncbi:glycosyltransferase family 9 protein [Candidatus Dependentiae bacterium]|nr:glycosyltransferase family 9 protein [Candidatus Dependentiae bacterium]
MNSNSKKKILIIKLGYSETLDAEIGNKCSLGDVLRTTSILHIYKEHRITWLTDESATELLEGNPFIERILSFNLISVLQLMGEKFDIMINLEKTPGICSLADKIDAWQKYGFRLDAATGKAEAYEYSQAALNIATREDEKKRNNKCWQKILFEMLNKKWNNENYILSYKPSTKETYDIGFNMFVGPKFPVKAWPIENWKKLEKKLNNKYSITYQESLNNINGYIDWLNKSKIIITNDSLGLHLAVALNKKVIALIGPTSTTEIPTLPNVTIIKPSKKLNCIPCFKHYCKLNNTCMNYISVSDVEKEIKKNFLKK